MINHEHEQRAEARIYTLVAARASRAARMLNNFDQAHLGVPLSAGNEARRGKLAAAAQEAEGERVRVGRGLREREAVEAFLDLSQETRT